MKNILLVPAFLLVGATLIACLNGCSKNGKQYKMVTTYHAVYTDKATVLAGLNGNKNQSIESAGNIVVKAPYIFINDVNKGIHIVDNSNPARPIQIAFLSIPGNTNMAVKGNTLYANMYAELLTIDISNPAHANVKSDIQGYFPGSAYAYNVLGIQNGQVATSLIPKDTIVEVTTYTYVGTFPNASTALNASSSNTTTGTAGSMSSMVIAGNRIYSIAESHSLSILDISSPTQPIRVQSFYAGFDLETVYPFEDKLFLGSSMGVYIYDISNPDLPVNLGTFTHGRACDPVITDGQYAYVTLHTGTTCGGIANELDVLDVKNPTNATIVKTYPMTKPTGLSKDGNLLFVGDGPQNVKLFNAANPNNLQLLHQVASGQAYDVITQNGKLIIVSDKGIYQYSYKSDGSSFQFLSRISLGK